MQQQQQIITVPSGVEYEISLNVVQTGTRQYKRGDYRATVEDNILNAWRGDVTDGNYLRLPEGEYSVKWPTREGFSVTIIEKPITLASGGDGTSTVTDDALNSVALGVQCYINFEEQPFAAIPIIHVNQQTGEYVSTTYVTPTGDEVSEEPVENIGIQTCQNLGLIPPS